MRSPAFLRAVPLNIGRFADSKNHVLSVSRNPGVTHRCVSLLGVAEFLGEEDQLGLVLLQSLDVRLQTLDGSVLATEVDSNADRRCYLLGDVSRLRREIIHPMYLHGDSCINFVLLKLKSLLQYYNNIAGNLVSKHCKLKSEKEANSPQNQVTRTSAA